MCAPKQDEGCSGSCARSGLLHSEKMGLICGKIWVKRMEETILLHSSLQCSFCNQHSMSNLSGYNKLMPFKPVCLSLDNCSVSLTAPAAVPCLHHTKEHPTRHCTKSGCSRLKTGHQSDTGPHRHTDAFIHARYTRTTPHHVFPSVQQCPLWDMNSAHTPLLHTVDARGDLLPACRKKERKEHVTHTPLTHRKSAAEPKLGT